MKKTADKARRPILGTALPAALLLLLSMTLLVMWLLAGCEKTPKTDETPAPSTEAASVQTTIPPETGLPAETEPAELLPTEPVPETLPPDFVPALNRTDISFFGAGESFVLTVPHTPASIEILWSAEDEKIASVDKNGRVTAVGPGSARVYAEIAGTKLSCWVRCQFDAPPAETDPTLNKTDISFFGVGESFRLSVSNIPENAQVLWSSEDYGVAYVDENGRVRAVGPGTIRVKAQVGETVLSCWVRCQFAAPELPRSSVADGSWLVTLRKVGVTVLDEEAGVYVAVADLLSRIQVTRDDLDSLEPYGKLDLSRFGLGSFRVSDVAFSTDEKICTVTAGDAVLLFSQEEDGLWTLVDATGEAQYYSSGTARFVFCDDSGVYEQAGGNLTRRANVLDLFGKEPGFEESLSPVEIAVSDGLVAKAVWYYKP